ncbi:hypothetical protein Pmani_030973 [Petrolisthes manimaculis]|uniref:Uncharacterized protein n=1 Tax=Petrolisthes manimaculis TaxID=1843537 RepID=A0AAE1NUV0_9EUCA|nr:hypothetical protein Pmani_030973 [Petrolisthes manimaculis]
MRNKGERMRHRRNGGRLGAQQGTRGKEGNQQHWDETEGKGMKTWLEGKRKTRNMAGEGRRGAGGRTEEEN